MLSSVILAGLVAYGSAAIKCGGLLPLQNFGVDLYCGLGAPACPSSAFCQTDVDNQGFPFSVCCPFPGLYATASINTAPLYNPAPLYVQQPANPLYANPSASLYIQTNPASLYVPRPTQLYQRADPATSLYIPKAPLPPVKVPAIAQAGTCPDTGLPKADCPVDAVNNPCLNSDCSAVSGASCMIDYCNNCAPMWYAPDNTLLTAAQCSGAQAFPSTR